jgi:predicted nucleic acid-binding Zn ribbon protein
VERVTWCLMCGSASPAKEEFCTGCGAPLMRERRKRTILWIVLVAVAVAGAVACLI